MYSFNAQAEYSYFSADFRLKIFLFKFLDYRVLHFIRSTDMSVICLVLVLIVLLASFVGERIEITNIFKIKI